MHKKDNPASRMITVLIDSAEIMLNGVMVLSEDGHILGINTRFAQELGYDSKKAFHPKTIFEVNPDTSLLSWKRLWKKLLNENQITLETVQITSDDAVFPVRMRGILLQFGDTLVCLCIIENLMQSNRFKDLLNLTSEIAGVGSWEWDLIKDEIVATREVYRMLNLSPNQSLSSASFEQIIAEKLNEKEGNLFLQNLDDAIKKTKAFDMELSIKNDVGFENYHLHARPLWHENQTIKVYGTLQNLAKVTRRTDDLYFTKFCMDNARDMIFWVKEDGTLRYVNQTACIKLGYSVDELLQKNIELVDRNLNFDLKKQWKQLKKEGSLEFETEYFSKDGQEISVSVIANYINYLGTEFNCCFVRDMSVQKKRSEIITMAKHTLDNSLDMIFWLNYDGSFRYFNDTFLKNTGFSRSEILKMKIFDFFPDSDIEKFQNVWKNLRSGVDLGVVERELRTKDGNIISCEMTVSILQFGDNEFSSNILRNVSERKKKERQIALQYEEIERLQKETQAENIRLKEEIDLEFNFNNIISRDPNYKKVLRQVEQVADTDATVLILGETGTGKELLARAIHKLSSRDEKPLIKINCGSLPENLIESELFGHEKGAFTGAYQQKIGKFERAHRGTVFLDEIGELPLDLQTKLLRVLQEGEIERVGGTGLINIDVRIIAATNRNLEQQVAEGKFREDLFYRLNVFPIHNIPLRERREDIPILVKYFAEKYSKRINKPIKEISQLGLNKLMGYNFLGNVRELENLVERSVILAKSNVLTFDIPFSSKKRKASSKFKTMEEMQRYHIVDALKRTNGKVSGKMGAAELLGMNDKTLVSRMKKLGVSKFDFVKNKFHI